VFVGAFFFCLPLAFERPLFSSTTRKGMKGKQRAVRSSGQGQKAKQAVRFIKVVTSPKEIFLWCLTGYDPACFTTVLRRKYGIKCVDNAALGMHDGDKRECIELTDYMGWRFFSSVSRLRSSAISFLGQHGKHMRGQQWGGSLVVPRVKSRKERYFFNLRLNSRITSISYGTALLPYRLAFVLYICCVITKRYFCRVFVEILSRLFLFSLTAVVSIASNTVII
jgi:hypothetical protein